MKANQKSRFLIVYISVISVSIICGFSTSRSHGQSFYPDDFGNMWVLRSTDGIEERTVKIEGPEVINGESLRVINDQTNGDLSQFFVRTEPDGIKLLRSVTPVPLLGDITVDYSPAEVFMPNPLELGTTWTFVTKANVALVGQITSTNHATVVAIEDVVVPVGAFRGCLKVEIDILLSLTIADIRQKSVMWLAPSVGLVKSINSSEVVFELIRFEVAPSEGGGTAVRPKAKLATTWAALKQ